MEMAFVTEGSRYSQARSAWNAQGFNPGTLKINEFALKLKGREADTIISHRLLRQN